MRILTTGEKTALEASRVRLAYLIELQFAIGTLRLATAPHSITVNGNEWLGMARLLDVKLPREDATLEAHKAELTLGGLDPSVISLALNEDLENAPALIHLAEFHPDTNVLIGMHLHHRGTVGQVRIDPPKTSEQ